MSPPRFQSTSSGPSSAAPASFFPAGVEEEVVAPEVPLAAAETDSLEEMARELGRSLLDSAADDEAQDDEEAATFLASWSLSQHEMLDELSPIPLTTTLADEFDLLDDDEINSLITRL